MWLGLGQLEELPATRSSFLTNFRKISYRTKQVQMKMMTTQCWKTKKKAPTKLKSSPPTKISLLSRRQSLTLLLSMLLWSSWGAKETTSSSWISIWYCIAQNFIWPSLMPRLETMCQTYKSEWDRSLSLNNPLQVSSCNRAQLQALKTKIASWDQSCESMSKTKCSTKIWGSCRCFRSQSTPAIYSLSLLRLSR